MKKVFVPLHPSQQDIYLDQIIQSESPHYNIGGYIKLVGKLQVEELIKAVRTVPDVFDIFKARFDMIDQALCFYADSEYKNHKFDYLDFSGKDHPQKEALMWMQDQFNKPFAIKTESLLFKHCLLKISDNEHWFFNKYHHLITDGYGFSIWSKYIAEKYRLLLANDDFNFNYPSYFEQASFASQYYRSPQYQLEKEYWRSKFTKKPQKLLRQRHAKMNDLYRSSGIYIITFSEQQLSLIENLKMVYGASLQQLTIAALIIYFGIISNQKEVCIGVPVHKRRTRLLRNVMGMFAGIIPFKGIYQPDIKLIDFINGIGSAQKQDYRYQNYLVGDLKRDLEYTKPEEDLFEIVVNYANLNFELDFGEDIKATTYDLASEYGSHPLQFWWREYGNQQPLQLRVDFQHNYFHYHEVETLVERVLLILTQFLEHPNAQVGSIKITLPEERQLLVDFNQTQVDYPAHLAVVDLFQQQAARTPSAVALVFQDQQLTYHQLDLQSNQLAHYLRSLGVSQQMLVGICLERSLEMVISILAILKAGAAYVPIDPAYPAERIAYMLADSAAPVLISSGEIAHKLAYSGSLVDLVQQGALIQQQSSQGLAGPQADELAYVIYTSGSTGRPKGVMIEHKSLVDYVYGLAQKTSIKECSSFALVSTLAADLGNTVIYSSLLWGGCLHICSKDLVQDGSRLAAYFSYHQIACLKIVPSHWQALASEQTLVLPTQLLVFGGEPLAVSLVEQINKARAGCQLVNHYGPTETTIGKLLYRVDLPAADQQGIPIGQPFGNTQVYVLGQNQQLVPIGATGEIHIGGAGLARGYLNQAELTQQKFIANPFGEGRLYKTGDLGRWLEDGNLEYLGRMDEQVKLRGYRIELGEIEQVLQEHPQLKQCVVVLSPGAQTADGQPGEARLVAYLVSDAAVEMASLREYLLERLPEYMVPSAWVQLESIPLTSNGKVDRQSLTKRPVEAYSGQGYVAPRSELEQALANIWQELLGVEQVGIYDNFFELGGHSLLAIRVSYKMRVQLQVEISIKDLFNYRNLEQLALYVEQIQQSTLLPTLLVHERPEQIPLSFNQERLWFIDQLEGSVAYHTPSVFRIKGKVNIQALNYAFTNIVERHEVLRTLIHQRQGKAYQKVVPSVGWQLQQITLKVGLNDEQKIASVVEHLVQHPFDLTRDYKLRAHLICLQQETVLQEINDKEPEYILVLILHHIASDGWSRSILVEEFVKYYQAYISGISPQLPSLLVQYADYALWQRTYLSAHELDAKLGYWRDKLQDVSPLNLPTDFPRPSVRSNHGAGISFKLDKSLSEQLQQLSRTRGVSLFMTLLSAFKVLLYRYSGQSDIAVGSIIAGRQHQEVEGLIGFFVNTLVLRDHLQGETSFLELLEQVKQTALDAYEHQQVPFEKVVEATLKQRDASRTPLFQVLFDLQNTNKMPTLNLGSLEILPQPVYHRNSKFDIGFLLEEDESGIQGGVEYSTDLYQENTIVRLLEHFQQLLKVIVEDPNQQIQRLQLLAEPEQRLVGQVFSKSGQLESKFCLRKQLQQQLKASASATALVHKDTCFTYLQLERLISKLSLQLQSGGKGARVAVLLERSEWTVVTLLTLLFSEKVYIPLDSTYPKERLCWMLLDAAPDILITQEEVITQLDLEEWLTQYQLNRIVPLEVVRIELLPQESEEVSLDSYSFIYQPQDPAYVIYTSGSTGKPKGVEMSFDNLNNFCANAYSHCQQVSRVVMPVTASTAFDISLFQLLMPLMSGGTCLMLERQQVLQADLLIEQLSRATVIDTVPALYQLLVNSLKQQGKYPLNQIERVFIGGDTIADHLLQDLAEVFPAASLVVTYGPTEGTIFTSQIIYAPAGLPDKPSGSNIGHPLSGTQLYVLDKQLQLQPIGVAGEICIGGLGVSRGYIGQSQLTSEKFVASAFGQGRLYRTGDQGRWLEQGQLEFLGRIDGQVKVRGYRIELGEIESCLHQHPALSQAAVIAIADDQGNKSLSGYYQEKRVMQLWPSISEYLGYNDIAYFA